PPAAAVRLQFWRLRPVSSVQHLAVVFSCVRIVYFSYVHGNHRDLRSFPTRRSSDLSFVVPEHRRQQPPPWQMGDGAAVEGRLLVDRKSTRLNSSHQIISYAVFSLKKKSARHTARLATSATADSRGAPPNTRPHTRAE